MSGVTSGLALGDAAQSERPEESVGDQSRGAGDLRQPPRADPPVEVHLPEAILPVAEALAEPEVGGGLRADRRHPPAVADDLDAPLETADLDLPGGTGKGASEEVPPDSRGRGRDQGGADPHPLGARAQQAG